MSELLVVALWSVVALLALALPSHSSFEIYTLGIAEDRSPCSAAAYSGSLPSLPQASPCMRRAEYCEGCGYMKNLIRSWICSMWTEKQGHMGGNDVRYVGRMHVHTHIRIQLTVVLQCDWLRVWVINHLIPMLLWIISAWS